MKELKDQAAEFKLWGWTEPFRARFLLFSILGLVLVIWWQDRQMRAERDVWQERVAKLQNDIEDCLKETAAKIEAIRKEQFEYMKAFDSRTEKSEKEIKRLKSKK